MKAPREPTQPCSVSDWLSRLESLHPKPIDLGLERVAAVLARLELTPLPWPVISVAGTNGKGSSIAILASILTQAGLRVGAYTSPHLLRFNERVVVNGAPVADAVLCQAFSAVERCRGDTSLTYFEFTTLAALEVFCAAELDVVLLEVGLGGRLDAVNAVDADVALLTTVDMDHQQWLGDDREVIGQEKAGIFRRGRPAVCGDPMPPRSVAASASATGAHLLQCGVDFGYRAGPQSWSWWSRERTIEALPRPALAGEFQLQNAAAALMALEALFPGRVDDEAIRRGLANVRLSGRFQHVGTRPHYILDVAHNPQSARALAGTLNSEPCAGRTFAVFGMLADKAHAEVISEMRAVIDVWYVVNLATERSVDAHRLAARVGELDPDATLQIFADVGAALPAVRAAARPADRVVVFGSFYTVAEALQHGL